MPSTGLRWVPVTLTLVLMAPSCSSLRKVRECERVIDVVNGGLGRVAAQSADAGASPETYARLAEAYDGLASALAGAASDDPVLGKTFDSYRELIERAAKQSRAFSEELDRPTSTPEEEKEKEGRLARLRTQGKSDAAREAALVRKINGLCHPQ